MSYGAPEADQITSRPRWVRWLVPCAAAALFARSVFRDGLTAYNIGSSAFVAIWMLAAWLVVIRTRRPRRSFYAVGLASMILAALFVAGPAASGMPITLGVIAWIGVTALALIWVTYYERSETSR